MSMDISILFDTNAPQFSGVAPEGLREEINFTMPQEEALLYTRIKITKGSPLMEAIALAHNKCGQIVHSVEIYLDEGLELHTSNPYGNPIKWVKATHIVEQVNKMINSGTPVLAMLRFMHPDTVVYIWLY